MTRRRISGQGNYTTDVGWKRPTHFHDNNNNDDVIVVVFRRSNMEISVVDMSEEKRAVPNPVTTFAQAFQKYRMLASNL